MSNDLIPNPEEMKTLMALSQKAKDSPFFTKLGGEGGILSIMLYARELGLPPMQCLFGGMYNVNGCVTLSSRMMNAMIRKAGHVIEKIECTNERCSLKGTRVDTKQSEKETYTIGDATLAGNAGKDNWKKNPSDMLYARCLSRLARRLFPDVIGTAYVEGEIPGDNAITLEEAVCDTVEEAVSLPDITFDEACEKVAVSSQLTNNENLRNYIGYCMSKNRSTLAEFTNQCTQSPERVIKTYETWLKKQESKVEAVEEEGSAL